MILKIAFPMECFSMQLFTVLIQTYSASENFFLFVSSFPSFFNLILKFPFFFFFFQQNKLPNLNQAFDLANQMWSIPKLLDAEDTQSEPDDVCVIIYLAFYCRYMCKY